MKGPAPDHRDDEARAGCLQIVAAQDQRPRIIRSQGCAVTKLIKHEPPPDVRLHRSCEDYERPGRSRRRGHSHRGPRPALPPVARRRVGIRGHETGGSTATGSSGAGAPVGTRRAGGAGAPVGAGRPVGPVGPVGPVAPWLRRPPGRSGRWLRSRLSRPSRPSGRLAPLGPVAPVAPEVPEVPVAPVAPVGTRRPRSGPASA